MANHHMTPEVEAISQIHFTGNIIPISWYKQLTSGSGKPHFIAITILSDIVYWYRSYEVRDEGSGHLKEVRKKFKGDFFQRSSEDYAKLFGFSKRNVVEALGFLEKKGIIKRHFRNVRFGEFNSLMTPNVLYIELIPEAIRQLQEKGGGYGISYPPSTDSCNPPDSRHSIGTKITTPVCSSASPEPESGAGGSAPPNTGAIAPKPLGGAPHAPRYRTTCTTAKTFPGKKSSTTIVLKKEPIEEDVCSSPSASPENPGEPASPQGACAPQPQENKVRVVEVVEKTTSKGDKISCSKQDIFAYATQNRKNWTAEEMEDAWKYLAKTTAIINSPMGFVQGTIDNHRKMKQVREINRKKANPKKKKRLEITRGQPIEPQIAKEATVENELEARKFFIGK